MKNKEVCLYVASVDVGVLLESHCKQMICIQFGYDSSSLSLPISMFTYWETRQKYWSSHPYWKVNPPTPPAPFILSPPPCRCWMGGPCGRTAQWESYSSCQALFCCLRLWSESRRSQPSRMNGCCHSTWTDGGRMKTHSVSLEGNFDGAKTQLNMEHYKFYTF